MELEIRCKNGDMEVTTVDWPEETDGSLRSEANLGWNGQETNNSNLYELMLHHEVTRPGIAKIAGLSSGHGEFEYKVKGEKKFRKDSKIVVSGQYGNIVSSRF
jgi:hypothetical protein